MARTAHFHGHFAKELELMFTHAGDAGSGVYFNKNAGNLTVSRRGYELHIDRIVAGVSTEALRIEAWTYEREGNEIVAETGELNVTVRDVGDLQELYQAAGNAAARFVLRRDRKAAK